MAHAGPGHRARLRVAPWSVTVSVDAAASIVLHRLAMAHKAYQTMGPYACY